MPITPSPPPSTLQCAPSRGACPGTLSFVPRPLPSNMLRSSERVGPVCLSRQCVSPRGDQAQFLSPGSSSWKTIRQACIGLIASAIPTTAGLNSYYKALDVVAILKAEPRLALPPLRRYNNKVAARLIVTFVTEESYFPKLVRDTTLGGGKLSP